MTNEYGLSARHGLHEDNGPNDGKASQAVPVVISSEMLEEVERKHILLQDIEETIRLAEKNGKVFANTRTGTSLAWHRHDNVTFWVEYRIENDARTVVDAYSHRMVIGKA